MLEILKEAVRLIESGRRGALATIISTTGSTPGKESARLLVRDDGTTVGTVGGGCTENEVWKLAMEVIGNDRPIRTRFRLTAATAAETGLLCGGEFEVYIEPVGHPNVVIFGAGHCARSLARLLAPLEYRTTVVDDRESYADPSHFPAGVDVVVSPFESCARQVRLDSNAYVVIVTRGHDHDETVLEQVVRTDAPYVGLIGSRGKIGAIFKNLRSRGISDEALARVRAPIGIDIGSRSPDEVAISIAAEIIAFRRGVAPDPRSPRPARSRAATEETDSRSIEVTASPASAPPPRSTTRDDAHPGGGQPPRRAT
ncbi:MAG: XdhC family protein [Planctomycetes bacterium]|nr:XdhC family protein [Planctomycetota bacterium]